MSNDARNLFQRLHAVQEEVDYIQKEKKAGMRYSIVSHDAVTAKVRPVLHKHRVLYYPVALQSSQDGNRTAVTMGIRFVNIDSPADFIDVPSLGYGIDDQDKGPGKAISYAVKYALLKTLGLESGDDPDLDQEAKHNPAARPAPAPVSKSLSREAFATLQSTLRIPVNAADLQDWYEGNKAVIASLPDDWRAELSKEFRARKEELSAKVAA
jgi:hypothetical protein